MKFINVYLKIFHKCCKIVFHIPLNFDLFLGFFVMETQQEFKCKFFLSKIFQLKLIKFLNLKIKNNK